MLIYFSYLLICYLCDYKLVIERIEQREIMDRKILEFVTYCISKLAQRLNLSQNDIYDRLKNSGILYDYIVPSYDVLHTFGSRYLIDDLTNYMKEKGVLPK